MTAPRKLTHSQSDMTRLKTLWRDSFSGQERDYWRKQFESPRPLSELSRELQTKYHVTLPHKMQLYRFRRWIAEHEVLEAETRKAAARLAKLENLGLTGEQLREMLLHRLKSLALAGNDFNLGTRALKLDLQAARAALNQRKLALQSPPMDAS